MWNIEKQYMEILLTLVVAMSHSTQSLFESKNSSAVEYSTRTAKPRNQGTASWENGDMFQAG